MGLSKPQLVALREALERFAEVRVAVMHGSAAESGPFRDVDVALLLGRTPLDGTEGFRIADAVAAAVEAALRIPCDAHVVDDARPAFRYNVTRGVPIVLRDPELWDEFKEHTWNQYLDVQWLHDAYLREVAEHATGRS